MYNWLYKGKEILNISDLPENAIGFVYKIIRDSDGKFYVGKKNLYSERSKPLTKKELSEHTGKGKKPTKKKVVSESDWKTYYGSEKELKEEVRGNGPEGYSRYILHVCFHKKQLTYQEIRHQILEGCLESENSWNSNVLGKFFKKDI